MTTVLPAMVIGSQLGPYRIEERIGEGGMGVVYRAVHTLMDRPAAIKVLHPECCNQPPVLARFGAEARTTTAIRHPGIVEIYDYGRTATGQAYIAMELLEGETLGVRLRRQGAVPLREAMILVRRIAAPLAVVHERGIVHRDLKPDNVFLVRDPDGGDIPQVKILDFGIAKVPNAAPSNRTTIGVMLGTPTCMSPEQCLGAGCDHRTDLYALGCIAFELLTGRPPYSAARTLSELLAAHMSAPVPDVKQFATVPTSIADLVARMLAKNADHRPSTTTEVVLEIDRWLASHGSGSVRRGTPWLAVAIAAALGSAITGTAVWSLSRAGVISPAGRDLYDQRPAIALPAVTPSQGGVVDAGTWAVDGDAVPSGEHSAAARPVATEPPDAAPAPRDAPTSHAAAPARPRASPQPVLARSHTDLGPHNDASDPGQRKADDVNTIVNDSGDH